MTQVKKNDLSRGIIKCYSVKVCVWEEMGGSNSVRVLDNMCAVFFLF